MNITLVMLVGTNVVIYYYYYLLLWWRRWTRYNTMDFLLCYAFVWWYFDRFFWHFFGIFWQFFWQFVVCFGTWLSHKILIRSFWLHGATKNSMISVVNLVDYSWCPSQCSILLTHFWGARYCGRIQLRCFSVLAFPSPHFSLIPYSLT